MKPPKLVKLNWRRNGRTYQRWAIEYYMPKRKREVIEDQENYESAFEAFKIQLENYGTKLAMLPLSLRMDALYAQEKLAGTGWTLRSMTDRHLVREKIRPEGGGELLCKAADDWVKDRQRDFKSGTISKRTIDEIRIRRDQFKRLWPKARMSQLDAAQIRRKIKKLPVSQWTKRSILGMLSQFFFWARVEGLVHENPCDLVSFKVKTDSEAATISLGAAEELLFWSEAVGEFALPYCAVCLFAGLRPGEAEQLDWSRIDFKHSEITILAATSKARETHFAPILPVLTDWLAPYQQERGPIIGKSPQRFRMAWELAREAAGYHFAGRKPKGQPWVKDVLRHTFASFWLSVHQDRAKLAEIMANTVEIIKSRYKRAIPERQGREFLALTRGNVLATRKLPIGLPGGFMARF